MPIDIRPFNEESSDLPIADDSRSTTFMDALRSRVADGDEKERQKWEKAAKPVVKRKPLTPARPEWLGTPKSQQTTPKSSTKANNTNPFGKSKKKRTGSNSIGEG